LSEVQRSIRVLQGLARVLYVVGVLLILIYLVALSSDLAKPDFFLTAVILILAGMNVNTVSALRLRVNLLEKALAKHETTDTEKAKDPA